MRSNSHRVICLLWATASAIFVPGCGSDGLPGLVKLRGEVTYAGKPVPTGQVVFLPSVPGKGRQASGTLDTSGQFTMTTLQEGDGVMIGDYDVIVLAYDKPPGEPTREEIEALGGKPWRNPVVPKRYINGDMTDLHESVTSDHSGAVRYELKD